jgi:hypothetical protein
MAYRQQAQIPISMIDLTSAGRREPAADDAHGTAGIIFADDAAIREHKKCRMKRRRLAAPHMRASSRTWGLFA